MLGRATKNMINNRRRRRRSASEKWPFAGASFVCVQCYTNKVRDAYGSAHFSVACH